jgi:hypothetical protein
MHIEVVANNGDNSSVAMAKSLMMLEVRVSPKVKELECAEFLEERESRRRGDWPSSSVRSC